MQLDRSFQYPTGIQANQIATLEHVGAFDAPVRRLTPLVDPRVPDPSGRMLDARARSYLHANCSNCHRPDGPFNGLDLRVDVPLAEMKLCNALPQKGDQGVAGAKLLVPGMPNESIVYLRMQAPDKAAGRMPTLASSVLDTQGLALVSDWIKATAACP
jgi:mono/diheme cytochrome c family protein